MFNIPLNSKLITKSTIGVYLFFLKEGWLIISYTIVLFLPEFRRNPLGFNQWFLLSLPFCFVIACFICVIGKMMRNLIGRLWGNIFQKTWHTFWHVIIYSVSFIDIYLLQAFHLTISRETFLLVLQTNTNETQEFLSTYIFEQSFLLCLILFVLLSLLEWMVLKFSNKINVFKYHAITILCIIYAAYGIIACNHAYKIFTADNVFQAVELSEQKDLYLGGNSYIRIYLSSIRAKEKLNIGRIIDKHINETRVNTQTNYNGNIVLIIGESHMKRHVSLYGYNKETNPLLKGMNEELCIFNDVITPKNKTHIAFHEIFSVSSLDDNIEWNKVTLFPAVFKATGWNVILCSNQITDKESSDIWNAAVDAFLNTPKVTKACFTTRNHSTFKYDEQMVDSFIEHHNNAIDVEKPSLYVINLMGQHMKYSERFPEDQAYFSIADYSDRKNLSNSQKQEVADYDNACRYNDKQLYKLFRAFDDEDAIVIYMSDHGEEVYDYRDKQGRFEDLKKYAPISYHYQIDVPFMVYMTKAYKNNHPRKAHQIEASVNRPFMTDDICHLLFYLGDVDTEWFNPSRCLIHDNYNQKRKRRLYDGEDYDEWAR